VQNVVTYTAVIGVRNLDQALLPGMTANLQIVTDEREDVLRIPNAALRFRPAVAMASSETQSAASPRRRPRGQDAQAGRNEGTSGRIYRVGPDGNPQAVPVRLGVTDGAYTEILRGDVQEGAAIIVGAPRADGGEDAGAASGTRRPRPPRMF